jgi:hypothetical protein
MEIDFATVATQVVRLFSQSVGGNSQRGMLTWGAEGSDQPGQFFSRVAHFPGGASGVTIGRGYDMKLRSRTEVLTDLTASGVPQELAFQLSNGAGLYGERAATFTKQLRETLPPISVEAERKLFFDRTYPFYVADTKRIFEKPSVQAKYGRATWDSLDGRIQDLLVDLRYRGDYTPKTRALVQRLAAQNDVAGLADVMSNRSLWPQVPLDRFRRRAEWL